MSEKAPAFSRLEEFPDDVAPSATAAELAKTARQDEIIAASDIRGRIAEHIQDDHREVMRKTRTTEGSGDKVEWERKNLTRVSKEIGKGALTSFSLYPKAEGDKYHVITQYDNTRYIEHLDDSQVGGLRFEEIKTPQEMIQEQSPTEAAHQARRAA